MTDGALDAEDLNVVNPAVRSFSTSPLGTNGQATRESRRTWSESI